MLSFLNRIIRFGFYAIFLFVPIALWGDTSELFEFNKLWVTYILAIIIGCAWIGKMILRKRIIFQRTLLEIFLFLFLASQIISTVFSWDPYVSWWGYYSRFNGGLLSLITYIFLYCAFVSNIKEKGIVIRCLKISLISGLITALWGLPSHFGYDPTCFLFRGQLNVDCWTNAFQPQIRMFSTLGQPDWFAAYLSILIPVALAFSFMTEKRAFSLVYYPILASLFYIDFLYTRSKGSFIAQIISFGVFFGGLIFLLKGKKNIFGTIFIIALITFFLNTPFGQLHRFTFAGFQTMYQKPHSSSNKQQATLPQTPKSSFIKDEGGGTDSGKIRSFVWSGAITAWKHYPLIGTGVETFAYAYYKFRPPGHNLTSEWDYLYNKAHNEYLNYLTTTGIFGLGTYLILIGVFLYFCYKRFRSQNEYRLLTLALLSAYLSIIISNFFGFSVVIVNLYFFLIPAFVFILSENRKQSVNRETAGKLYAPQRNIFQNIFLFLVTFAGIYLILVLSNYWQADRSYALGMNLDHANAYMQATTPLRNAVASRPDEPVYKDELSINDATLAVTYASQKDATTKNTAQQLAQEAIQLSDDIVANHPNSLIYWKSRIRIFYLLSQVNPNFLSLALAAAQKAHTLAPTDAKISYNLGLLYAQTNAINKGIETLKQTIALKPDYHDAYYALGVLLHQKAVDKDGKIIDAAMQQQAVKNMRFILMLSPTDKQALDMLRSWGENP